MKIDTEPCTMQFCVQCHLTRFSLIFTKRDPSSAEKGRRDRNRKLFILLAILFILQLSLELKLSTTSSLLFNVGLLRQNV